MAAKSHARAHVLTHAPRHARTRTHLHARTRTHTHSSSEKFNEFLEELLQGVLLQNFKVLSCARATI